MGLGFFFFQAEGGIRDGRVTGVQTCALPILRRRVRLVPVLALGAPVHHRVRREGSCVADRGHVLPADQLYGLAASTGGECPRAGSIGRSEIGRASGRERLWTGSVAAR